MNVYRLFDGWIDGQQTNNGNNLVSKIGFGFDSIRIRIGIATSQLSSEKNEQYHVGYDGCILPLLVGGCAESK